MSDREAFEKWARRTGFDLSLSFDLELVPEGYYGSATTRSAWNAWQAALQGGEPVGEVFEVLCEGRIVYAEVYDGAVIPHKAKLYAAPQSVVPDKKRPCQIEMGEEIPSYLLDAFRKAFSHYGLEIKEFDCVEDDDVCCGNYQSCTGAKLILSEQESTTPQPVVPEGYAEMLENGTPYVIQKSGMYYAHGNKGYVSRVLLAELYTKEYAESHCKTVEECRAIPVTDLITDAEEVQEYIDRLLVRKAELLSAGKETV